MKFDTLYTQWCTDLRRHRDYELTAAGWFTVLQIGLATVIAKLPDSLIHTMQGHRTPAIIWGALVSVIGSSGVLSVAYTKARTRQLGTFLNDDLLLRNTRPLPESNGFNPYFFIVTSLTLLAVINLLFGQVVLGCPHAAFYIYPPALGIALLLAAWKGWMIMFRAS